MKLIFSLLCQIRIGIPLLYTSSSRSENQHLICCSRNGCATRGEKILPDVKSKIFYVRAVVRRVLLDNFCERHYARRGNTLYDYCTPCEHLAVRVSNGWGKLPNLIPVAGSISHTLEKCARVRKRMSYKKLIIYKT